MMRTKRCYVVVACLIGSAFLRAQSTPICAPLPEVVGPVVTLEHQLRRFEVPSGYDFRRLGWFCKLDVRLERNLPFPLRFRLGDPMRVDALEGKGPMGRMYGPPEEE